MSKVQIPAVLSMDGCHIPESYCKAYKKLHLSKRGISEIRRHTLCHITPDYFIPMFDEWRKDNTRICYLAGATPEKVDYINGLLRMRAVDGIIFYIVPFITGTGRHFFQSVLPET